MSTETYKNLVEPLINYLKKNEQFIITKAVALTALQRGE